MKVTGRFIGYIKDKKAIGFEAVVEITPFDKMDARIMLAKTSLRNIQCNDSVTMDFASGQIISFTRLSDIPKQGFIKRVLNFLSNCAPWGFNIGQKSTSGH